MTTPAPARDVKGVCRCEARIAPAILDGYSCGNADCWRTAAVRASFDAFVAKLVAGRDGSPAPRRDAPAAD